MTVVDARFVGKYFPEKRFPISEAYWETDALVADIGARFGISANQIARNAGPAFLKDIACRECGSPLIDKSRSDAIKRVCDLQSSYGNSKRKTEAMTCDQCLRQSRERRKIEQWGKYRADRPTIDAAAMIARRNELTSMPYDQYLRTPEWKEKRSGALKRAGYACQVCSSNEKLHVHHRTYLRRGSELDADLTVLCEKCHSLFHEKSKLAGIVPKPKVSKSNKRKLSKKQRRAAAKAVGWVREIAAAKFSPHEDRAHKDSKLGTFGPASDVRIIDPSAYPSLDDTLQTDALTAQYRETLQ